MCGLWTYCRRIDEGLHIEKSFERRAEDANEEKQPEISNENLENNYEKTDIEISQANDIDNAAQLHEQQNIPVEDINQESNKTSVVEENS